MLYFSFIFDISEGYPNVIAYIVQVFITKLMIFICTGTDCIFMTIALHTAAHFTIVGNEIEKIEMVKSNKKSTKMEKEFIKKKIVRQNETDLFNDQDETSPRIYLQYLKGGEKKALYLLTNCIKRQNTATKYVNTIENIFSSQVFIHFSTKSFSLCFALFQATLVSDLNL